MTFSVAFDTLPFLYMFGALVGSLLSLLPAPAHLPVVTPMEPVKELSSHQFSLENRYATESINRVFAKNILLTLAYIRQGVPEDVPISWAAVESPFQYRVTLQPGKVMTYHSELLSEYKQNAVPLTDIHFSSKEGFLSDGYLVGDGTCHLASLIAWAARDAGLPVEIPTNHNFAPVPDVPKEHGVSIYASPSEKSRSERQNLYITNNKPYPVTFTFTYDGRIVTVQVQT